jgi:peptidoglycan/LPS O-acetylase OafA/YrhL
VTLASTPIARLVLVVGAVLIALGEVPRVVEPDRLAWIVPLDALFHSSAVGGTLVLTGVGHVTTRALLRAREVGRAATVFTLLRVLALLWVLQLAVLVMVAVARAVDTLAPPDNLSGEVWSTVLTFRWNLWLTSHMLEVPGELIGLALLSIAAQLVTLLALVVVALPRRWNGVAVAIGAALSTAVIAGLRVRVLDLQDPYVLLLDTFARSDAFLVGVLAACLVGLGRKVGPAVSSGALVVLVGAVLASKFVSTDQQLVVQLPVVALLAGLALLDPGDPPGDSLTGLVARSSQVDALAVVWAPLVACVTPAAVVIGRRTEMHWVLRVTVLVIVVAIITRVALALAERVRLPDGPLPTLSGLLAGWRRVLAEADAEVRGDRGARPPAGPGDDPGGNGAV